jgi:hypothetical protein
LGPSPYFSRRKYQRENERPKDQPAKETGSHGLLNLSESGPAAGCGDLNAKPLQPAKRANPASSMLPRSAGMFKCSF